MKYYRFIFKGGLGNQLFQYAYYKHLLVKDKKIKIDLIWFYFNKTRRFSILNYCVNIEKINICYSMFFRIIEKLNKNKIVGYYQHQKYPDQFRTELLNELVLKIKTPIYTKLSGIIQSSNYSVGVHIRRGDYLNHSDIYELCGLDYFKNAISIFNKRNENISWFIFTDDVKWLEENMFIRGNINIISKNNLSDSEELMLLKSCKGIITSNSTFSWWAAWLNNNDQKVVVTPSKWLKNISDNSKLINDIIPKNWIQI